MSISVTVRLDKDSVFQQPPRREQFVSITGEDMVTVISKFGAVRLDTDSFRAYRRKSGPWLPRP